MPTAILSLNQYKNFQVNGEIPEFNMNGKILPAYAFEKTTNETFGSNISNSKISLSDMLYLYKRCDIAANAVDLTPETVWGKGWKIKLYSKEGKEIQDSPLINEYVNLTNTFNVSGKFRECHVYARLFGAGIMVLGLKDNKDLSEPVDKAQGLNYLTVFSRDQIKKIVFDEDPNSETYGQIQSYNVQVGNRAEDKFTVHVDRVIHVMEKTINNSPWGISVLEAPYDLFTVLKNTDWAAGEAYYQNASPLYVVSWDDTDPQAMPPTPTEKQTVKNDIENLNVHKRILKPKSWTVEVVSGSGRIADPTLIWNTVIERIAGAVRTPKQLLLGTSAGALASGETNLSQWYSYIANQQTNWAQPYIAKFYSKLQKCGVLPEGNIGVEFPTLWEMDEKEKAQIFQIKMSTAVAAVSGEHPLMTVEEARTKILDLNPNIGEGETQQDST
jgi:phage-related protein (TIGR01555 family)